MTRKKKILIAAAVILFVILLFLLIWFLNQKSPMPVTVVTTGNNTEQTTTPRGSTNTEITEPKIEVKEIDATLQSLAITFAERYGSYSTATSFANLYDVMDLMTASLKTETADFIAKSQTSSDYYGVTTKALSVKIISSDENTASLEISTQRDESKGSPQNSEVKYQTLLLTCLQENGVWKVAAALWQ